MTNLNKRFHWTPCRRSTIVDLSQNSSTVVTLPVDENLRYATTPSSLATSGTYAQLGTCTRQEDGSALNYSRLLIPAHATVDPGRQPGSQNQISSNVSERYEFAEIQSDKPNFEHEDYSCLKH